MGKMSLLSQMPALLISDPGYKLVKELKRKLEVTSCPGPSSPIVAITLSGLPSDKFFFSGFLPVKVKAKKDYLEELKNIKSTLIFLRAQTGLLKL